ncbi:Trypsin-like peptidase domain-containing protein [Singulisphaera sp. GP187]|uniref:trypsin-like peptidase domain-containing protein n=1 Tax=Singulisphaera sp. GP187 TaxID=1882752 RepID=UPI00092BA4F9|nr:trypsin-like peptidase domain-containing protein [Singulisphaera sp. GP187]SIO42453.1 Trypsin-like peptidase domain-containing protein [Singulisphaera sp. GP187]
MAINLETQDLRRLAQIVSKLAWFENSARERRQFVEMALGSTPRAETLRGQLGLDTPPAIASVEVITKLARFGQVEYGKEALGVFLNAVIGEVGVEIQGEIRSLFDKYPLDAAVSIKAMDGSAWQGEADGPSSLKFRELILDENTLYPIHILQRAIEASHSVNRVVVSNGNHQWTGTGFLVAPDLIMTNHHVIRTAEQARGSTFVFNFELDTDCAPKPVTVASSVEGGLFYANETLDFAVVQVASVESARSPLKLGGNPSRRGDAVTIIGHPNGHLKQISLRNNAVEFADATVIQYTASTEPGSSGSPILDLNGPTVVGIHHSSQFVDIPGSPSRVLRNAGTAMGAILADLKDKAPSILAKL